MILEVCVDSVESAVNAELGGADRIELCGDLIVGGTTPSLALYERIREKINIPIHVLLRPRFGDFLYSEEEIEILTRQAEAFSKAGADALVIGCLTADGQLDTEVLNRIMDAGKGTPYNLHRAFICVVIWMKHWKLPENLALFLFLLPAESPLLLMVFRL